MSTEFDFGIVGGGIIGLSLARDLAGRGAKVVVINRPTIRGIASTAAAGMLSATAETLAAPQELIRLSRASRALWPSFAEELETETDVDVGFRREGTYLLAENEDHASQLRLLGQSGERGISWQSAGLVQRAIPTLEEAPYGALFCEEDRQVDNRQVMLALRRSCRQRDVLLLEDSDGATGWLHANGRIEGVTTSAGEHRFDQTILAAGIWSERLLRQLMPDDVPSLIEPVKGQMVAVQMDPDEPLLRFVLRTLDTYLVPRNNGRLIIGATSEIGNDSPTTDVEAIDRLLGAATELIPDLADLPILEAWSGIRPRQAGSDSPILGADIAPGLKLVSAHYRNGVLLAPITATLVGKCCTCTMTAEEIALLSPFLGIDECHKKLMLEHR